MEDIKNAGSLLVEETTRREDPGLHDDPRLPVDENATLLLVNQGSSLPCRVVEIGLTGCRFVTLDRFLAGTLVRVEAAFKLRAVAFRFSGVVERTDEKHEVGVRFSGVTPRRMEELVEVLCDQAAENASRTFKQAAERLAAKEKAMKEAELAKSTTSAVAPSEAERPAARRAEDKRAEEKQAEVPRVPASPPVSAVRHEAKLPELATRKSAAPVESYRLQSLPAFASSSAVHPQPLAPLVEAVKPPANPAARERRKQPREQMDTFATIHLVNIASRLRGRIMNLSLGGCSICTAECFPVGIYTRVETEFHLEGLPFRLGGVVQTLPDRKHVGIRFLDMSERKREQVEQLMGEIAKSRKQLESGDCSATGLAPGIVAGPSAGLASGLASGIVPGLAPVIVPELAPVIVPALLPAFLPGLAPLEGAVSAKGADKGRMAGESR